MSRFAVILPAAGKSSRFRDREKKPFASLDGRAVWLRCAELFITRDDVCQCVIVVAPEDQETFRRRYQANLAFMNVQIADGGKERFESVANALALVKPEAEFVAIHDAARPCVTIELIDTVFASAAKTGAAMLAMPVTDTVKRADDKGQVKETVARQGLWLAQTPLGQRWRHARMDLGRADAMAGSAGRPDARHLRGSAGRHRRRPGAEWGRHPPSQTKRAG